MDRALYWNLPASLVFTTLLVYVGLVLFARYGDNDPVGCVIHRRDQVKCSSFCLCLYSPIMCAKLNGSSNEQKSNNLLSLMKIERNKIVLIWCLLRHTCTYNYILFKMIPWFVMDVLGDYAGFPGLMVACIFSASLRWELTLIIRFKMVRVRIGNLLSQKTTRWNWPFGWDRKKPMPRVTTGMDYFATSLKGNSVSAIRVKILLWGIKPYIINWSFLWNAGHLWGEFWFLFMCRNLNMPCGRCTCIPFILWN